MKPKLLALWVLCLLCAGATPASASAIIFDLNCYITSTGCTAGTSFGTLTLVDVTYLGEDAVRLDIDLDGSGVHNIQKVTLNYDAAAAGTAVPNSTLSDGESLSYNPDGVSADGYQGDFDIEIPATGNLGFEPYSAIIYGASSADLFSSYFNLQVPASADIVTRLYAAVHIGTTNCSNDNTTGCDPGTAGTKSLWVGATGFTIPPDDPPPPVPEPSVALLLAAGLGLAGFRRRRAGR